MKTMSPAPRSGTLIQIKIQQENGFYYITSDDVPGLHLWGDNIEVLFSDIIPAIKALYKHNKGIEVELFPAEDPDVFPCVKG